MKNLNKNPSLSLMLMIVLHTFFASIPAVDWQGYGNMSASNLTDVWAHINNNVGSVVSSDYGSFTTGFSEKLNQLWHPAWNIFTIKSNAGIDSVVYGYAFRNHWMWYNGFISKGDILTFIIWKDYNCYTWINFNPNSALRFGFGTNENTDINAVVNLFTSDSINDIWAAGKRFIDQIATKSNLAGTNKAYSIVISQDSTIKYFGSFCAFNGKYKKGSIIFANSKSGSYLIFQTRLD